MDVLQYYEIVDSQTLNVQNFPNQQLIFEQDHRWGIDHVVDLYAGLVIACELQGAG
jgi:hypothetical protein